MVQWIVRWFLLAAALLLLTHWLGGLTINGFGAALIVAAVLGLVNSVVRPILIVLTLPVTVLTMGLFLLVINGITFYLTASLLDQMAVSGFGTALLAAALYSLCSLVIDAALQRLFASKQNRDPDVIG